MLIATKRKQRAGMMMLMIENSSSTHSNSKHRQQGMKPVRKDGDDAVHHREEMKVAMICFDDGGEGELGCY